MTKEKIKDEKILTEVAEDLDKASECLERAFGKLAELDYVDNDNGSDLDNSYKRVDESAIVNMRQNILEKLGQI